MHVPKPSKATSMVFISCHNFPSTSTAPSSAWRSMLYTNLCTEFLSQDQAIIENSTVSSQKLKKKKSKETETKGDQKKRKREGKSKTKQEQRRKKRETRHNSNRLIF
jgi:hypothetical protein